ncbi:hypothetical protein BT63DRAFT_465273 [Microthyrium microscopicum]|uniref:Uncharacterized protein n=1 Tax=Microthyrium microscopicum TaxID=703497 RepID=A0A6A6TWA8_9PEZI|nr:hypothetical protein BT63DRAFT_465273 [Microthyrium microscopicum]
MNRATANRAPAANLPTLPQNQSTATAQAPTVAVHSAASSNTRAILGYNRKGEPVYVPPTSVTQQINRRQPAPTAMVDMPNASNLPISHLPVLQLPNGDLQTFRCPVVSCRGNARRVPGTATTNDRLEFFKHAKGVQEHLWDSHGLHPTHADGQPLPKSHPKRKLYAWLRAKAGDIVIPAAQKGTLIAIEADSHITPVAEEERRLGREKIKAKKEAKRLEKLAQEARAKARQDWFHQQAIMHQHMFNRQLAYMRNQAYLQSQNYAQQQDHIQHYSNAPPGTGHAVGLNTMPQNRNLPQHFTMPPTQPARMASPNMQQGTMMGEGVHQGGVLNLQMHPYATYVAAQGSNLQGYTNAPIHPPVPASTGNANSTTLAQHRKHAREEEESYNDLENDVHGPWAKKVKQGDYDDSDDSDGSEDSKDYEDSEDYEDYDDHEN